MREGVDGEAREVRSEVIEITPQQAARWLEQRAPNRRVESRAVLQMARDMVAGRWLLTHQGIGLDADGMLLDGQHRLSAIIIANVPIKMMVTSALPRETMLVIDDHRRRTGSDVLTIERGVAVDHTAVAILRLMEMRPNDAFSRHKFTKSELSDAFTRHGGAVHFVQSALRTSHVRGVTTAAALAPVARAFYSESKERLKVYLRVLASGIPDHATEDVAALRFRDWLIEHRESHAPRQADVYSRAQVALRKFLDREDVKVLRPSTNDLFPVPAAATAPRSVQSVSRLKEVAALAAS